MHVAPIPHLRTSDPFAWICRVALVLPLLAWLAMGSGPVYAQADVQIVHNSGDPAAKIVDIYIENDAGTLVQSIDNVAYRDATGFLELPEDTYEITIAQPSSTGPDDGVVQRFSGNALSDGTNYTVLANGVVNTGNFSANPDGKDIAFDLDIATGARETVDSPDGDVEVRVAHGVTDAPTVDVQDGGGTSLVDNAAYTDITGYISVPAGQVTLEVTPDDDNTTSLYTYEQDLSGFSDTPLTVIATGFNTPSDEMTSPLAPFTLIAVAPNGTVVNLGSDLVINEFLADPAGVLDANHDGTANSEDQFVELFNVSTTDAIDLTGYTISTSDGTYTFDNGPTLDPGEGLVVFECGSPTGFSVFVDTELPDINSSGDEIVLADASGTPLQTVRFGSAGTTGANEKGRVETDMPVQSGVSTAREVNGSGTFVLHTSITANPVSESAGEHNVTGNVLPVELADFSATLDASDAVLTWRTLSEDSNSGFQVQHRSPSTSAFETVGFRNGQGTTTEETSYRFRLEDLATGTHEFRLKQVNMDGSSTLTDVISVDVALDRAFAWTKVAPNPVSSTAALSIQVRKTQDVTVRLFDVLGRRVRTLHDGLLSSGDRHQLRLNGRDLSNGTYVLRVRGASFSRTQQLSVVK